MKNILLIVLFAASSALTAQIERPKWEFGGGIRLNYMGLDGGMSGFRNSNGYSFDLDYQEIGMDNYSPSFAIALGGRYKKWNLEFAGSRGVYDGSFTTPADIVRDEMQIDSGSAVNGTIDMSMYALVTNFGLIQRKHDLGVGVGFLLLNMGSNYTTIDTYGEELKLGDEYWFPMPFLALTGRLKFNKFRVVGSGGGAIFIGTKDDINYNVGFYTVDINVGYDFLEKSRVTYSADLGYRYLYLGLEVDKELGWYHEKDIYLGPYATIRIKFSSKEMWKFTRRKDQQNGPGIPSNLEGG